MGHVWENLSTNSHLFNHPSPDIRYVSKNTHLYGKIERLLIISIVVQHGMSNKVHQKKVFNKVHQKKFSVRHGTWDMYDIISQRTVVYSNILHQISEMSAKTTHLYGEKECLLIISIFVQHGMFTVTNDKHSCLIRSWAPNLVVLVWGPVDQSTGVWGPRAALASLATQ